MSRKPPPESPLYVRIPTAASEKLGRAAEALGVHKKDLIAGLVTRYVDPDSPRGLDALDSMAQPRRDLGGGQLGSYSFQPYDPPEVMNAEEAAQFLRIEEAVLTKLAEVGGIPARRLGGQWRFSRSALIAWLAQPETKR